MEGSLAVEGSSNADNGRAVKPRLPTASTSQVDLTLILSVKLLNRFGPSLQIYAERAVK